MANLNIGASLATVNTLAGLPVDKGTVYATLSAPSTIGISATMYQGQELKLVINPTTNMMLPMPTATGWYTTFGDTLTLIKGVRAILTITCIGSGQYVIGYIPSSTNTIDGHEFVDLGLPSGTLWATCNVGASQPYEYGKYFQWGATVGYYSGTTEAKNHSKWNTAPFNNGSSDFNSTYFGSVSGTVCPNSTLALQYDAARANMGGAWRMPTSADTKELYQNTTSGWTSVSGVEGMKFTSNKSNSSNSIFIPAAGQYYNSAGLLSYAGARGFVWSSTLYSSSRAYNMAFQVSSGNSQDYSDRYYGMSVRGVIKP